VQEPLARIPWYHHIALLEKLDDAADHLAAVDALRDLGGDWISAMGAASHRRRERLKPFAERSGLSEWQEVE
jgi:hypothetical protein